MMFSNSNILDDDNISDPSDGYLKVTQIATCSSQASTVSDSKSDDDAFLDRQLVRPNQ